MRRDMRLPQSFLVACSFLLMTEQSRSLQMHPTSSCSICLPTKYAFRYGGPLVQIMHDNRVTSPFSAALRAFIASIKVEAHIAFAGTRTVQL